jgi:hypothetical protein
VFGLHVHSSKHNQVFQELCNKKNKTFRALFDRSKFLFVIFADETPAIKEQKDSDEKGAKADGIAGPAVSHVFQEKNDGRKINQIAQATTRITQEQISKMRERLEKTLASVILKSHDSLENIQEERFKRVEETNAELKRSQERLENFLQHLEDKILHLEVIQQQTLGHATKAATAANALDKLPQRFSEKMHEPELGSSRSPNKKKSIKSSREGILKSNRISSRLVAESQMSESRGPGQEQSEPRAQEQPRDEEEKRE